MNTIMEEILLLTEEGNTKKHRKAARAEIYGAIQKANSKLTEILNVYAKEFEGEVTKKPDEYIVKTPYMFFYRDQGLLGYRENEEYGKRESVKRDVEKLLEFMRKKNENRYYDLKVYRLGSEWEKYYDEACHVIDIDKEDNSERFYDKDFDKKNLPGSGNGLLSQAISDRVRSGYINKNIKQGEGDVTFTGIGYRSAPGEFYNEKPHIGSKLERNIEQRIETFSKNASVESLKYFKKKFPRGDFDVKGFKFNANFIFEKFYGGTDQLYIVGKDGYRRTLEEFLKYCCGIDEKKIYQEKQTFSQYIKDKFKYEIDKIKALNNKKHTIKESCFNY